MWTVNWHFSKIYSGCQAANNVPRKKKIGCQRKMSGKTTFKYISNSNGLAVLHNTFDSMTLLIHFPCSFERSLSHSHSNIWKRRRKKNSAFIVFLFVSLTPIIYVHICSCHSYWIMTANITLLHSIYGNVNPSLMNENWDDTAFSLEFDWFAFVERVKKINFDGFFSFSISTLLICVDECAFWCGH